MSINRRDFLKLSGLLTASTLLHPGLKMLPRKVPANTNAKNVLIVLFDALSASNINFYGYPRETMPLLTRLLDRATVYHNHYASSNFTTPGTASLLTGRHPWEHLALKLTDEVKPELATHNIFNYFQSHYKLAYTHNNFADILLSQFNAAISHHEPSMNLFLNYELANSSQWLMELLKNDRDAAVLFNTRLSDPTLDGYLYSLLFPSFFGQNNYIPPEEISARFPLGLPEAHEGVFILEDATDWILQQTNNIQRPFLGFFHLLPPHAPYNTREDFSDHFLNDNYQPPKKPLHPYVIPSNIGNRANERENRQKYDEFILYVDTELNRLITGLEQQGVLENTMLVVTTDHGEMFERKYWGHNDPYLFEPTVKIPLVIFEPGQTQSRDIYTLTSCIDLIPTLLHYTGQHVPVDLPGKILPPYSDPSSEPSRTVFALDSRLNSDPSHIAIATLMIRRENWKILRYSGYADYYRTNFPKKLDKMQNTSKIYYEVFDLDNDPEELNNLAISPTPEIQALTDELEEFYRENVEYPQRSFVSK